MTTSPFTAVSNVLIYLVGFDTLVPGRKIILQVSWPPHIQSSAWQTTELSLFPVTLFAHHIHSVYAANVATIKPKPEAVCASAQDYISQTQNATWLGKQHRSKQPAKCILIITISKVLLSLIGALEKKIGRWRERVPSSSHMSNTLLPTYMCFSKLK